MVACLGHGEPTDEVREPAIGESLQLRILVEVVVDVPGLVADDQVVVPFVHDVVEHHEVVEEDLVHPAPGLEAVQPVLAALGLDVCRLARQPCTGGMHRLARVFEHPGDRVLGQPIDLEVGMESSQLIGDCEVATGVAQADGGRDVERPLRSIPSTRPRPRGRRCLASRSTKSRIRRLTRTGSRARGRWPAPSSTANSPPASASEAARARSSGLIRSSSPWMNSVGTETATPSASTSSGSRYRRAVGQQDLRRRLGGPANTVLMLLGGVWLAEALGEEEVGELVVVLDPELGVEPSQPDGVRRARHRRTLASAVARSGCRGSTQQRRPDEDGAEHPVGMIGAEGQCFLRILGTS